MSEIPGRSPKKWSRVVQQIHVKFLKSKVIFDLSIFGGVGWSLSDLRQNRKKTRGLDLLSPWSTHTPPG